MMTRPTHAQQPYCHRVAIASLDDLSALAQTLCAVLTPGDVLALQGPMGAGKTTFTQALGQAMGVTEKVVSPTFVLIHEYQTGNIPLVHADLYRLGPDHSESIADELLAIVADKQAVMVVEWADYGAFLTESLTATLQIEVVPDQPDQPDQRVITVTTNQEAIHHALR